MEIEPVVPLWLMWAAAGGMGVVATAAVVRMFEAVFDLDPN